MRIKQIVSEKWSEKYKRSINCKNPKGFSQKAHCAGKKKNEQVELDEDLRKWFKEKWVRFGPDGKIRGSCARGSEGEGKPKCLPQSKAHSLGKKGRAKAARRKRREDPNPKRKGKAKNVATKEGYSSGITGGSGLGITKSPIQKVLEKPLIEKKVDEAIDLKKLVTNTKKLKTNKTHIGPKEAYVRVANGKKDVYLIHAIAKDAMYSYGYAKYVLKKKPFPLGEPAIAKDAYYSYLYARDVLKGPFALGEPAIAKDAHYSFMYARDVLKGPFALGEPTIAKDAEYSSQYVQYVLEKPFPLGEPAIAKDAYYSYFYARNILKGPFPLGEPAIAKDTEYSQYYAKDILKGRPWTGLKKKKVKEAIDLKKMVSDPTKLKTVDTHISPEEAYDRLKKGEKDEYLIHAIAKDAQYSHVYAEYVLKNPFPLGEPAIAKNADSSYRYARHVLKKPFPLGEPAIAKDAEYSYRYAQDVLEKPFPLGEPAISKSAAYSRAYALYVLKKPFLLGEPTIAKDAMDSYWYAKKVLKNPFPLGEPAIAKDARYSGMYEHYVLKGRPWTGLKKKKIKEAIDLKKLVSNPKKLKTNKTHVSPEEALKRLQKGQKDAYLINAIVKSPNHAFDYAYYVLRAPFPEGEPAIAKNAELAIEYARNILKGRFRLAEPLISKYADLSYDYAKSLNKRFIMGEPAIARDWYVSKLYMDTILGNSRFKIVEPYVARSPMHAYEYARQIGDRFKLGEPTIATDSYASLLYIKNILKGRFKLAEPTIAKEKLDSYSYAALLNSRFPLGEPKIATDAYLSYIYAKNIIKGRFKMGEPAIKENSKLWLNYKEFIHSLGKSNDIDEGQIYSTGGGPGESYRIMKPKHVDHYDDTSEGKVFKGLQREDEYSEGKVFKGLQRENVNTSPYNKTNKPPALSVLNTFIQVLNKPNNRYTPEYILDHYNRIYGMNYSVLTLKQVAKKIPYKLAELEDALAKGEQLYGSFTR